MHQLCFFFSFYYVLILVASCKMCFVAALTLHVVASKTISYFSNSACMLSRKQSKMLSELREEEEDAEQGAILSPNRVPGSKVMLWVFFHIVSPTAMCNTIVFCPTPEVILTIFLQACLLIFCPHCLVLLYLCYEHVFQAFLLLICIFACQSCDHSYQQIILNETMQYARHS